MPVAYGWSVGDIIGGIKLLLEAGGFLYNAYHASEEFAAFSTELSCATSALNACSHTNRRKLSQQLQDYIQTCINQSGAQIRIIQDEVDSYEANLGAGQGVNIAMSTYASSKWSLLSSQKIKDARHNLSMCIGALNVLMQTAYWEGIGDLSMNLSSVDSRIERGFDSTRLLMNAMSREMNSLRAEHEQAMQALSVSISNLARRPLSQPGTHGHHIGPLPPPVTQPLGLSPSHMVIVAPDACSHGRSNHWSMLPQQELKQESNGFRIAVGKWVASATQADLHILRNFYAMIQEPRQRLDPQLLNVKSILDKVLPVVADIEDRDHRRKVRGKKPMSLTLVTRMALQGDAVQSEVLLDEALQQSLLQLILSGISQLILAILFTFGCSRWMHPAKSKLYLQVEDNIQFYDYMSSEPLIIQYEIVLDLENFRSLLLQLARNTPGEAFVQKGKFRILDQNSREVKLTNDAWLPHVVRGGRLFQSIDIGDVATATSTGLVCPKPSCFGSTVSSDDENMWFDNPYFLQNLY